MRSLNVIDGSALPHFSTDSLGLVMIIRECTMVTRHGSACTPGMWAILAHEDRTHRVRPPQMAVVDDFGTLVEVSP